MSQLASASRAGRSSRRWPALTMPCPTRRQRGVGVAVEVMAGSGRSRSGLVPPSPPTAAPGTRFSRYRRHPARRRSRVDRVARPSLRERFRGNVAEADAAARDRVGRVPGLSQAVTKVYQCRNFIPHRLGQHVHWTDAAPAPAQPPPGAAVGPRSRLGAGRSQPARNEAGQGGSSPAAGPAASQP